MSSDPFIVHQQQQQILSKIQALSARLDAIKKGNPEAILRQQQELLFSRIQQLESRIGKLSSSQAPVDQGLLSELFFPFFCLV